MLAFVFAGFGFAAARAVTRCVVPESVLTTLEDSDFVPVGERREGYPCGGGSRGGNGVRIPICRSVRVEVNPGRGATLSLPVIVIRAAQ